MAAAAVTQKPSATAQPDLKLESAALKYAHLVVKVANFNTWADHLIHQTFAGLKHKGSLFDEKALAPHLEGWKQQAAEVLSFQVPDLLTAAYAKMYNCQQLETLHTFYFANPDLLGIQVNGNTFDLDMVPLRIELKETLSKAILDGFQKVDKSAATAAAQATK